MALHCVCFRDEKNQLKMGYEKTQAQKWMTCFLIGSVQEESPLFKAVTRRVPTLYRYAITDPFKNSGYWVVLLLQVSKELHNQTRDWEVP